VIVSSFTGLGVGRVYNAAVLQLLTNSAAPTFRINGANVTLGTATTVNYAINDSSTVAPDRSAANTWFARNTTSLQRTDAGVYHIWVRVPASTNNTEFVSYVGSVTISRVAAGNVMATVARPVASRV